MPAAQSVVPIPSSSGLAFARSQIAQFAARTAASSSPGVSPVKPASTIATAIAHALVPAHDVGDGQEPPVAHDRIFVGLPHRAPLGSAGRHEVLHSSSSSLIVFTRVAGDVE